MTIGSQAVQSAKTLVLIALSCLALPCLAQPDTEQYATPVEIDLAADPHPAAAQQASQSDNRVFGGNLFTGSFAQQSFSGFNPNYQINVGDTLYLQVWGAVEFAGEELVDAQGNIFIPQVGPVRVVGTTNSDLNQIIEDAVGRVYTNNVYVYTSLIAAQPVKVFVTGNVMKPGLYPGLSSDSILSYLDRAGGIDPQRGSFLDIKLKRNGELQRSFNLYDFLIDGDIETVQLHEGDVLVVGSRQYVVKFDGKVENPYQIEFSQAEIPLNVALDIAEPLPEATHISIQRNTGLTRQVEYLELQAAQAADLKLMAGDHVSLVVDKSQATIGVVVDGEHLGQAQYVLPYGATLGDLIPKLSPSALSKLEALQLFRKSLASQQKRALEESLRGLEAQVLSARSDTIEEAQLRTQEARLVLQFVERARQIQPRGQVVLGDASPSLDIVLENGDRIVIPTHSHLVSINGEVLFPSATVYQDDLSALEYIDMSGGFTQRADDSRVIVRRQNGSVKELSARNMKRSGAGHIQAGDEILVMPSVDAKRMQYAKDIFQIVYQLALSTGVVLSID